jgi:scyllo-inositol 2-dehydrogenase (NADP+)
MRVVVVGLGVQGHKRREFAGSDYAASVDPINQAADYKKIEDVPLSSYDAVLLCVPDEPKIALITYLLNNHKHVLVEKPLWALDDQDIVGIEALARSKQVVCYTAYNHRFEPHFMHMRDLIASDVLGEIYHCRMFYGNGTARLVRESAWRDKGGGVLPDLGSHLLDTASFWFGVSDKKFSIVSSRCFENHSLDHVCLASKKSKPQLEIEMTLLSWKNHFTCDIFAEKGSAHISSLCKWGPTVFTHRSRVLPSGRPQEKAIVLVQSDPTWALEYTHFKKLCLEGARTDLASDLWLNKTIRNLSAEALKDQEEESA